MAIFVAGDTSFGSIIFGVCVRFPGCILFRNAEKSARDSEFLDQFLIQLHRRLYKSSLLVFFVDKRQG